MATRRLVSGSGFLFAFGALSALGQQVDSEAMMKWGSADVIRYHIVGVYQGQPFIASDGSGKADVTDSVVIDLSWKLAEAKLVGTPTFQNSKTVVANLRDREASCLPPVLEGEYEHFEILGIKQGLSGTLELQVQTTYPVVEVAQSCRASRKSVPAARKVRPEELVVPSPVMLAMPLPDSDDLRASKDKKSLISRKNGWTWTFTPSVEGGKK